MKIIVKSIAGPNVFIPIPSGLILNRFAAGFTAKALKEQGIEITKEQAVFYIKELNKYRHQHPEWVLVEVQSANGEYVYVKL